GTNAEPPGPRTSRGVYTSSDGSVDSTGSNPYRQRSGPAYTGAVEKSHAAVAAGNHEIHRANRAPWDLHWANHTSSVISRMDGAADLSEVAVAPGLPIFL